MHVYISIIKLVVKHQNTVFLYIFYFDFSDVLNALCRETRTTFEANRAVKDLGTMDFLFEEGVKKVFNHPEPYIRM